MSGDPEQECFFNGSLGEQGCSVSATSLHQPPFEGNVGQRQAFADIGADLARLIRTTRHVGHGTMRKAKHRGIAADFMLNLIAYNLVRIPKLIAA